MVYSVVYSVWLNERDITSENFNRRSLKLSVIFLREKSVDDGEEVVRCCVVCGVWCVYTYFILEVR